jgi:glycerophosphoryl diester phosphodiesterase
MEILRSRSGKLLIEGHRAAEGIALENSWAAMIAGYEAGADLLEIDIHRAKDGSLVIYNGYSLPDGRWIRNLNRDDLQKIRIEGQELPFLDPVIEWVLSKDIGLSLDIKNGFGFDRQVFLDVLELLNRTNTVDKVILISWDHEGLRQIKSQNARIKTRLLLRGLPVDITGLIAKANADGLGLDLDMVTRPLIDQLHAAGTSVAVGMTHFLDIRLAMEDGVDIIQVTNPGEARKLLSTPL